MGRLIDQFNTKTSLNDTDTLYVRDASQSDANLKDNKMTWASFKAAVQTALSLGSAAFQNTSAFDSAGAAAAVQATLGTAATKNVGTSANNIPQLDSNAKLPAVDGSQLLNITSTTPQGYIYGLTLSNNVATPLTNIDISVGIARDSSNATDIRLSSVITKSISSTFVAGSGNGGRASAVSLANATWYHVFAIANADGSLCDVYFDTSILATNIPSGYTKYRRIGSVYYISAGSGIRPFIQRGNYFLWNALGNLDVNGNTSTTASLVTLSVPTGFPVEAHINTSSAGGTILFSCPDTIDLTPNAGGGGPLNNDGIGVGNQLQQMIFTNSLGQIRQRALQVINYQIYTVGWLDISLGVVSSSSGGNTSAINNASVGDYKMGNQSASHGGSSNNYWLLCDGSAVSRTTYSALFAVMSTSFGTGDGSTTFNLPDFRGKVAGAIGQGSGLTNRIIGSFVGEESHILTINEMPAHTHSTNVPLGGVAGGGGSVMSNGISSTPTTSSTGGGASHNNMQPTLFAGNVFVCSGIGVNNITGTNATNGYVSLPNGHIMQWGFKAATGTTMAITFPIAFPNACVSVQAQINHSSQDYQSTAVNNLSTTGATVYWANDGLGIYWQAIGY